MNLKQRKLDDSAHQPAAPGFRPDEPVGKPICRATRRPSRHRGRHTGMQAGRAGRASGLPGYMPTQPAQGPADRDVDRGSIIVAYYPEFCNKFIYKLKYLFIYETKIE